MKILFVTNPYAEGVKEIISELRNYGEIVGIVNEKKTLERYQNLDIDLVISDRVDFIFPKSFLSGPKICINTHPSLLPENRGSYPIFWSCILGGEAGISIHIIDEGIDTGPIVYQSKLNYHESETFREVHLRSRVCIFEGLKTVVDKLSKSLFFENLIEQNSGGGKANKKADTLALIDKLPLGWDTTINVARELLIPDLIDSKIIRPVKLC